MFWRDREDTIQRTSQLTQSMLTGDPWLIAVLDADRNGEESWEMYCFIHGLFANTKLRFLDASKRRSKLWTSEVCEARRGVLASPAETILAAKTAGRM